MKTIQTVAFTIAALSFSAASAFAAEPPPAPKLADALKYRGQSVAIFQPVTMSPGQKLQVTHIRMGDGSVKPSPDKKAVMLVVYSSTPNQDGDHEVLHQDFHFLTGQGSPVLNFAQYSPTQGAAGNQKGIIAILIGLLLPARGNGDFRPMNLPTFDKVSAEITPGGDVGIGLLLPAVQKVREAAAR